MPKQTLGAHGSTAPAMHQPGCMALVLRAFGGTVTVEAVHPSTPQRQVGICASMPPSQEHKRISAFVPAQWNNTCMHPRCTRDQTGPQEYNYASFMCRKPSACRILRSRSFCGIWWLLCAHHRAGTSQALTPTEMATESRLRVLDFKRVRLRKVEGQQGSSWHNLLSLLSMPGDMQD